jgi:acyl-CoA thioester hydrolase
VKQEHLAPPPDAFSVEVVAHDADIDELGHVSNIVYVRWIQEAALGHSAARGYDVDAYKRLGAIFVVRRHEIDYLSPVLAGEHVTLTTWIASVQPASSRRETSLARSSDGKIVARASTLWVLVSTEGGRPRRIPQELIAALGPRAGASAPRAG